MLRSLQEISGEELKVRSTDLGMIGLHGTLTRVFPEKQLGDEVGKTQQLPSSCLSRLQVAHLWLVFLIHHVMGYGQGGGWVRAPFSAGCDTTIWISVPVNLHKKAVSSQRYEFRIFSSLCPGECILCPLSLLGKIGFGVNGEPHFLVENSSYVSVYHWFICKSTAIENL